MHVNSGNRVEQGYKVEKAYQLISWGNVIAIAIHIHWACRNNLGQQGRRASIGMKAWNCEVRRGSGR